jgi:DNA repair exonuclease SbcCD nuclease subunit
MTKIRILFLADTHLGFDLPVKPRINRRRRGSDFFKNYDLALQSAFFRKVDLVIHSGDLFYRSKIPDLLISMAFDPLIKIADSGIPVILVPGNHERSFIKQSMFEIHHNINIFNELKSFIFNINNCDIQISGFPCVRNNIRSEFKEIIGKINLVFNNKPHIHLLCMHQAIEGAQVGNQNYTFRNNHDTIKANEIPYGYAAILSGHIHRRQTLSFGLDGRELKSYVYYPGSIERTSFAEMNENKGFLILDCIPNVLGGEVINYEFVELPCRPMEVLNIQADYLSKTDLINQIVQKSSNLDANCVVRIKIFNTKKNDMVEFPNLEEIRKVLPDTINISYKVE